MPLSVTEEMLMTMPLLLEEEALVGKWGREDPGDSPPPRLSHALRNGRGTRKNWKRGWDSRAGKKPGSGKGRIQSGRETVSHLETIWGRMLAVICRGEWGGPCLALSRPFTCALLLTFTPIPPPSSEGYSPSTSSRTSLGGCWRPPRVVRDMLTLDLAPPSPVSPGPQA